MKTCKTFLFLIFCASFLFAADHLDTIVSQSKIGMQHAHGLKGFIIGQIFKKQIPEIQIKITPQDTAKKSVRIITTIRSGVATIMASRSGAGAGAGMGAETGEQNPIGSDSAVLIYRVGVLENDIKDLKDKETKMTTILENLQEQATSHTENQNFMTKVIETICISFFTAILAFFGSKLKKKKE